MVLSIVILNYNTPALTIRCLESIIAHYEEQLLQKQFEIIVVDNASSLAAQKEIKNFIAKSQLKAISFLVNTTNEGFSKGCNKGAEKAQGKYIFFLNSDSQMTNIHLIDAINYLEANKNVAVLGAKLVSSEGKIELSTGKFLNLVNVLLVIVGLEILVRFTEEKIKYVDWVSGGALLVSAAIFKNAHGFDENIFMYMEDMEFCFRIRKMGYKVIYFPKLIVAHKGQGSSNRSFAIIQLYKNIPYYFKKHFSYFSYLMVKYMLGLKAIVLIILGELFQSNYLVNTYKKALAAL